MAGTERVRRVLVASTGVRVGGGIASVTRCVLAALREKVEAGQIERVDLLSLNDAPDLTPFCNGRQRTARGSQARFIALAWRMMLSRPELVFIDHLGIGRAFSLPLPGIRPSKKAVFVHGTEFWALTQDSPGMRVTASADLVLTNSVFTANSVRAELPQLGDRLRPVPLCIDPELTTIWERAGLGEVDLDTTSREKAVLIVARMQEGEPGKGHDTLIEAWPTVRASVPGAALWIAGDGTARPGLEALADRVGNEGIEFLGRISDEELARRYRTASLFAMPSRQEGFGLVYAEAMWHGTPAISTTSDAGREVVRDGETGAVVPYGDSAALAAKLVELLTDPARLDGLRRAAREEAITRFAYPRFSSDLLTALDLA